MQWDTPSAGLTVDVAYPIPSSASAADLHMASVTPFVLALPHTIRALGMSRGWGTGLITDAHTSERGRRTWTAS